MCVLFKLHDQDLFKNRKSFSGLSRSQMGPSGEDGDLKTWKEGKSLKLPEHEQKLRKDGDVLLIIAYFPHG